MRKAAIPAEECIARLEATANALESERANADAIMGALVKLMVRTAVKTRNPSASLDCTPERS
jgi:hypothetical protein